MLNDFIIIDKDKKTPLYRQIYLSVRKAIENGSLQKGTKMPSIRRLCQDLSVSKTTITSAYDQLCVEGYIKNIPQSGYYVEAEFDSLPKSINTETSEKTEQNKFYEYDFSGKSIDENIINISQWKKCVKDVINQNYLLTSYGDEQGELKLRNALQKYSLGTRSVNTKSENIIVGAGTQPLLYLLCTMLGENKKVAMADSSYVQSELVFKSFGYEINYFKSDKFGVTVDSLDNIMPNIILINPNFTVKSGANMPVNRRIEIINWAKQNNALIIEDDYNGELRYITRPMSCVQNYDTENTVYLGSFSKVLLPSVRISYMVLPNKLIGVYESIKHMTNQTASKTEQLALAQYIESGKIDSHLRKARRIYLEKSKIMLESINRHFKEPYKIVFNETSLYVSVIMPDICDREKLNTALTNNSLAAIPYNQNTNELSVSFSGISQDKIEPGIAHLAKIIYNFL